MAASVAASVAANMGRPAAGRSALAVSMDVAATAVIAAPEKKDVRAAAVIPAVVVTAISSIDVAHTSRQGNRQDEQDEAEAKINSISQTFCDFHREFFFEEDFLVCCP